MTTDLAESVFGVYNGKNTVIDWRGGLLQFLPKYSTPSGDPLIYISKTPYMDAIYAMGMYLYFSVSLGGNQL